MTQQWHPLVPCAAPSLRSAERPGVAVPHAGMLASAWTTLAASSYRWAHDLLVAFPVFSFFFSVKPVLANGSLVLQRWRWPGGGINLF